ncbi:MAG TPA: CSLREA domain-containing protein [Solimonas sp.]|nr:CSLREA domain-containing protein [Solimonas sp.]
MRADLPTVRNSKARRGWRIAPLLLGALAAPAWAATPISIDVTTLADRTAADGQCSLREAIALVNAGDQPLGDEPGGCRIEQGAAVSRIGVAPGLTSGGPAVLAIAGATLDIAAPLHLEGSGRDLVTLEGDGHTRLFLVAAGIPGNVTFSGLTLAQGDAVDDGRFFRVGGAIRALSPLVLDHVRVAGTTGGSGVAVESTSLDVSDTEFIHNDGAVEVLGHVPDPSLHAPSQASIRRSQFLENGVGLRVLGVQNQPQESHAELIDSMFSRNTMSAIVATWTSFDLVSSTLSDNNLDSAAGGISASHSTVHVANSTISGNTGQQAGAILLIASIVELVNSTIAGNIATSGIGDSIAAHIEAGRDNNRVTAVNTILTSRNTACDTTPPLPLRGSGNILASDDGDDASCLADAGVARQMTMQELKLAGLAGNGGPTPTRALLAGSPAIDAGVAGCPAADQRGSARSGACDIGSFEAAAIPAGNSAQTMPVPSDGNGGVPPTVLLAGMLAGLARRRLAAGHV